MADQESQVVRGSIINIEPDPRHPGRTIVSVRFDDSDSVRGPWIQAYSLSPEDRPISPEEFMVGLVTRHREGKVKIERPLDPFKYLREAKDSGKEFNLTISDIELDQKS